MYILQLRKNYLAKIRGEIGSQSFRHLYATDEKDVEQDLARDGLASCALYVSAVLHHFKLIEAPHATVSGLIRDMKAAGWQLIEGGMPEEGDVLIWEKAMQAGGEEHLHAGFYMGESMAISHLDSTRSPAEHHFTFGEDGGVPRREILAVYRHPKLA